jgi:hypothetical protein
VSRKNVKELNTLVRVRSALRMIKYIDQLGRWHVKPVTETDPFPTNNAYVYSFYAKTVGLPVIITNPAASQLMNLDETVLTRHPGDNTPPISHDEYVGAAGLDLIYATDIVEYGEKNYWQFCDVLIEGKPYVPTPWRKLVLDDVLSAYEDMANDSEKNVRKASAKYPALYPIAFWHRPEQQYFYYRCAKRSPGLFRTLYFIIATIASIFNKKSGPMTGFKLLKLKKQGPTLIERGLIKLFDKYAGWKDKCVAYFPEDHPILEKVKEL